MKGITLKLVFLFVFGALVLAPALGSLTLTAQAQPDDLFGTGYARDLGLPGDETSDPRDIGVRILQVAMSFLGIIAVVIILIGGFKWMTAGGNDDKVAEARKLIVAGIVGLIIILAAWIIANWVISQMMTTLNE